MSFLMFACVSRTPIVTSFFYSFLLIINVNISQVEEFKFSASSATQPSGMSSSAENPSCHALQGVPFQLSSKLATKDGVEAVLIQTDRVLHALSSMNFSDLNYSFETEKTFLDEVRAACN